MPNVCASSLCAHVFLFLSGALLFSLNTLRMKYMVINLVDNFILNYRMLKVCLNVCESEKEPVCQACVYSAVQIDGTHGMYEILTKLI